MKVVKVVALMILGASVLTLGAEPPAVKRNILLKQDMSIAGKEAVMALVELPPGSAEGKHTHPAEVFAYVQGGAPTLEVEGRPTVTLKPGDVFTIPPGKIHEASNPTGATVKLLAVFVAEKGKPLTEKAK